MSLPGIASPQAGSIRQSRGSIDHSTERRSVFDLPEHWRAIYRWSDNDGLSVFRPKSRCTGVDIAEYGQPGSNGLTLDREGRLTINEHGNRRVTRLEKNGCRIETSRSICSRSAIPPDDIPTPDGPGHVVERHACEYGAHRFGHVILQHRGRVVSLLVTAKSSRF